MSVSKPVTYMRMYDTLGESLSFRLSVVYPFLSRCCEKQQQLLRTWYEKKNAVPTRD